MRLLLWLSNPVRAFEPTATQLAGLTGQITQELVSVQTESEFLEQLPGADAVVVWRFLPEWYARAPRLRHAFTPSAGHDPLPPEPTGRVERHFVDEPARPRDRRTDKTETGGTGPEPSVMLEA